MFIFEPKVRYSHAIHSIRSRVPEQEPVVGPIAADPSRGVAIHLARARQERRLAIAPVCQACRSATEPVCQARHLATALVLAGQRARAKSTTAPIDLLDALVGFLGLGLR